MRSQRKKAGRKHVWLIFSLILVLFVFLQTWNVLRLPGQDLSQKQSAEAVNKDRSKAPSPSAKSASIHSQNGILVDLASGDVLWEKASREKAYPASLTKIMTAVVTLENSSDLDQKVSIDEQTIHQAMLQDASVAGFLPEEEVSLIDLIYGTLLPSGADASRSLAVAVAGSEKNFVRMMNEQADRLGMENTHFVNDSGLHDPNQYTTAEDMSLLLKYALKNNTFRQIFTSREHAIRPTNRHPDGFTLHSTLFTKIQGNKIDDGELIGGKTGYTSEAGLCLASLAEKNGREFLLVTMGAPGDHQTAPYNMIDAFTIYNQYTD